MLLGLAFEDFSNIIVARSSMKISGFTMGKNFWNQGRIKQRQTDWKTKYKNVIKEFPT